MYGEKSFPALDIDSDVVNAVDEKRKGGKRCRDEDGQFSDFEEGLWLCFFKRVEQEEEGDYEEGVGLEGVAC